MVIMGLTKGSHEEKQESKKRQSTRNVLLTSFSSCFRLIKVVFDTNEYLRSFAYHSSR